MIKINPHFPSIEQVLSFRTVFTVDGRLMANHTTKHLHSGTLVLNCVMFTGRYYRVTQTTRVTVRKMGDVNLFLSYLHKMM